MKQTLEYFYTHRKRLLITLCIIALGGLVMAGFTLTGVLHAVKKLEAISPTEPHYPTYPALNLKGKDAAVVALIKKGEYLTKAGDCIACHTDTSKTDAKSFAGGLAMVTPFGTLYSPNITPDKETGIGNWSEADFKQAMHKGKNPHGRFYYPAFPYLYFSVIKDEDIKALKAYFDQLPAVHQENRKNEMVLPFNWRFLQLGWRLLFFHPEGSYVDNPKESESWNRGKYLVDGLGHCAMCHSPSYHIVSEKFSLGAPISKYYLTGQKIQGYLAPDITADNLGNASVDEIVQVFNKDRLIGGGKVEGPMLEVNHDSLSYLSTKDLQSIAIYLKTVHSQHPPIKKSKGGPGEGVYEQYCSACHTTGAGGAPKFGDATAWAALVNGKGIDTLHDNAIHGINSMPAKGTCMSCKDEDIKAAVDYMVNESTGASSNAIALPKAPKPKPLTLEDGRRIYSENCSVCHEKGFKGAPQLGDKKAWQPIVDAGFIQTYQRAVAGYKDHPPQGACSKCNSADIKAAVKYMLEQGSADKDYRLW